jgi:hypothetical protein
MLYNKMVRLNNRRETVFHLPWQGILAPVSVLEVGMLSEVPEAP